MAATAAEALVISTWTLVPTVGVDRGCSERGTLTGRWPVFSTHISQSDSVCFGRGVELLDGKDWARPAQPWD